MTIYNLPEDLSKSENSGEPEWAIYNYEVPNTVMKNKINLNQNVISFLVEGQKEVRFANEMVSIDTSQALLITSGNFLMTEYIGGDCFKCLLFFFSQKSIRDYLLKYTPQTKGKKQDPSHGTKPYFQIEQDSFIQQFVGSLAQSFALHESVSQNILAVKFEEILLYLTAKYKEPFITYLHSLLTDKETLSFKLVVEKNVCTNLSIEEVAFLCNMSLSTFKRKFIAIYETSPGKWFQKERLHKARVMLTEDKLKPSEIYMDFGYNDLSSFSIAFKNEFGFSPKQVNL